MARPEKEPGGGRGCDRPAGRRLPLCSSGAARCPGDPRLSEFIRGLHAPGKVFPGTAAGGPTGTPPDPTERGHTDQATVHPLALSWEGEILLDFRGEFVFITVFFCFLFFIFSSQNCPQYLYT